MEGKSREIVDVKLQPWLGYNFSGGGTYFFKLRICKYIEVANYPLIQIGVSYLDLVAALNFTIAEVLLAAPLTILSGQKVPYANLSGEWTCPEDIKLDRATAPVIVNPQDYTELSVLPWTVPTFFESDLEYIPVGSAFTPIPESKTGMWKDELPGEGAIFMPNKSMYGYGDRTVATMSETFDYTLFSWWGQFVYSGCDLLETHILLNYDTSFPTSADPNSQAADLFGVQSCNSEVGGYPISEEYLPGTLNINVGFWGGWYDADYYPPREPIPGGGFPEVIVLPLLSLFDAFNVPLPGDKRKRPQIGRKKRC